MVPPLLVMLEVEDEFHCLVRGQEILVLEQELHYLVRGQEILALEQKLHLLVLQRT